MTKGTLARLGGRKMGNKMDYFLKTCILIAASMTLLSCGLVENMDKMLSNTKNLGETTEDMARRTAVLQRQNRQAVSAQNRTDNLITLNEAGHVLEHKIRASAIFAQAFDFQVWANIFPDDESIRQRLLQEGVEEYLIQIKGLLKKGRPLGAKRPKIDPLTDNDWEISLLAMSMTAERINFEQIRASQVPGREFVPVSILDMLTNSLLARKSIDENDCIGDARPYMCEILKYEQNVKWFLEARYNMLNAAAMEMVAPLDEIGLVDKLKILIGKGKWDAEMKHVNVVQINTAHKYLWDAVYIGNVYEAVYGGFPSLNKQVRKAFNNMRVRDDANAGTAKQDATNRFRSAVERFHQQKN